MSEETNDNLFNQENTEAAATNTTERKLPEENKEETKPVTLTQGLGNIYCLLIGINQYQHAADGVISNLNGCVEDLNTIERWLHDHFREQALDFTLTTFNQDQNSGDDFRPSPNGAVTIFNDTVANYNTLRICRLENGQATYQGIIDQFDNFLGFTGVADRIWIHFSGHGAETPTAEAFQQTGEDKDQCLLCHDFSIDENGRFENALSDKELAVLLQKISGDHSVLAPHIVVTIDGGHTGGTLPEEADFLIRGMSLPSGVQPRSLSDYLNGHFSNESENAGQETPEIPTPPYALLKACSDQELARERQEGFFTRNLISVLRAAEGGISYSDLQDNLEAAISQMELEHPQTPQLQTMGGTVAFLQFLEGTL